MSSDLVVGGFVTVFAEHPGDRRVADPVLREDQLEFGAFLRCEAVEDVIDSAPELTFGYCPQAFDEPHTLMVRVGRRLVWFIR